MKRRGSALQDVPAIWRLVLLSKHDMSDPCILHRSYLGNTSYFPGRHPRTCHSLAVAGGGYWLYWTPLLLRLLVEQRGSAPCLVWQSSFKFKQGSGRLSRSALPKGRLRWRLGL